jgi:hypothetical protein
MATATKRFPASPSPAGRNASAGPKPKPTLGHRLLTVVDSIYRFLASLKLAVFSLSALAASLAFATWFESSHGTTAAQDFVYKSTWFAVLLAFLAINILCAALIRFPWKRRQTGFVVTHAGLLVLIFGSYWSFKTADEGMVGMLEGEVRRELVRRDQPVFRVRELDPHTQEPIREYALPFKPGPFAWGGGEPRIDNLGDYILNFVSGGRFPRPEMAPEELSKPGDPFRLVVLRHLPASRPAIVRQPDPAGVPMARIQLTFQAPGMSTPQEAFVSEDDQWFKLDRRFYRLTRSEAPALVAFSWVNRPEFVDDFLNPPLGTGATAIARIRYPDRNGKTRIYDLALDQNPGEPVALPESDLVIRAEKVADFPTAEGGLLKVLGDPLVPVGIFQVRRGNGADVEHFAMASLPMVPNVMPRAREPGSPTPEPLVSIHLMVPPRLDPATNGRFGQIEVLAGPDRSLYYRVFGRGKGGATELRSAGPLRVGQTVDAFGKVGESPMTIRFRVEDYLASGIEKQVFEPVVLPKGQMDNAIAASLIQLSVGDTTRDLWFQRSESFEGPAFRPVAFGDRLYEIAYDVDRRPLGFDLKLEDFEVGFEPGTEQPTRFVSQVRLTDQALGISEKPHTISMNEPLTHRGFTFYQMSYAPIQDPQTGQRTGQFQSVFQVGIDPGRGIKYAGCALVVLGTFLQFYMRAGIFTDGGKRERERMRRKSEKGESTDPNPAPQPRVEDVL